MQIYDFLNLEHMWFETVLSCIPEVLADVISKLIATGRVLMLLTAILVQTPRHFLPLVLYGCET